MTEPLLSIRGLDVSYPTSKGPAHILTKVDLTVEPGAAVGLVGESGSGKSTLALALLGLLPENAEISASHAVFDGRTGVLSAANSSALRGRDIAMVFQDPMTALNPLFTIGTHLVDIQRRKFPGAKTAELWARGERVLARVGVSDAGNRMRRYPHEFSGGMRQRVVIAMALLVEPKMLIADEPTTALDATIEAQVVDILRELRSELSAALLVVSHSFGLIAELCETVIVMYAGTIVETGPVGEVLRDPRHPYAQALLACEIEPLSSIEKNEPLVTIPGTVPDPVNRPIGCVFAARCPARHERCTEPPPFISQGQGRGFSCWLGVSP
ncbi:ABC transporter ATP-binding protein [Pararhizobium sp. LjRoot238]|uniref:ABC transporter ATP-binding protein n=1 Tax=Pararhizobium sp. LjRoot238 TaxID=3342293 RepID=UPI003ED09F47